MKEGKKEGRTERKKEWKERKEREAFKRKILLSLGAIHIKSSDGSDSDKIEALKKAKRDGSQSEKDVGSRSSRSSNLSQGGRRRSSDHSDLNVGGTRNFEQLYHLAMEDDSENEILQSDASSQHPYYMPESHAVHGAAMPSTGLPEQPNSNVGLVDHAQNHPAGGIYQKIQYNYSNNKLCGKNRGLLQQYFWIKATWIGDEKKSVLVDIASEESLQYLQSKIGERMEETY